MTRLTVLSDDITGCVDSGALLASAGLRVHVVTDPGKPIKEEESDVFSVNLSSRTLSHEEAKKRFYETALALRGRIRGTVLKKLDTGFRGNASQEIEGVMEALQIPYCFLAAHAPWNRTYTLHGEQYFKDVKLAECLMAKEDPLKKPTESYLPAILSKDTTLKIGCVYLEDVRSERLTERVREILQEGCRLIVFDAVEISDGVRIAKELTGAFPEAMWAGTGGLAWGLSEALFEKSPAADLSETPYPLKGLCFSASAYSTNRAQIDRCREAGVIREIRLNIAACADANGRKQEVERVLRAGTARGKEGSIIVTPEVAPGFSRADLPKFILDVLGECAAGLAERVEFDRLAVFGGETAQAILAALGINNLRVTEKTDTGVGTGLIEDSKLAGKSFSFKGGIGGSPTALFKILGVKA